MTKSNSMSKSFARFAKNTTKGAYDEARKAERTARGVPFDIGTSGTGVVSIICGDDEKNGEEYPYVAAEISVLTPEGGKGKKLTDRLNLRWDIRDSDREDSTWTAQDAWGAALGMLERLGCPNELTSGYEDFQEVLDWFEAEPRHVSWEIVEGDTYQGRVQKRVQAYALIDPSSQETADEAESPEFPPNTKFCSFKGVRYGIIQDNGDELKIKNAQTGRIKTVDTEDVEME